ncbi:MAG TPA: PaaX family transcriptional regulator C-terminal domain-containing protein [Actinophytocola sp.]|uniref:PaaX family transcriptional regulator n=1 Tax=Actinophytocola sp. TaxID=1872138 RepID=UPI002DB995D8|nr:PaaX family transcriptional regulator C-terminal domain-containing protein [Actinophytocola sp.]HEU5470390.1 PaaX family transcriptional regulator C-terminal domain-containing protein [Actinophytocola sp.]
MTVRVATPHGAADPGVLHGFDPAPQDLVLTLLGAHVHPRHQREVWSGGLVRLLDEFGFSAGAARVALNRLVARQLLARTKDGRLVYYTLTPRTVSVLAEGDRRIFTMGRTARSPVRWTVLWHAIPEHRRTARARLVRRLRFLGFGSLQDGTWIAPHDREREIAALVAELDVAEHVGVLLGRPSTAVDFAAFIPRAWDLDDLSERYRAFVAQFRPYARGVPDDRHALLLRTRLVHTFRDFPSVDPELPADLVPAPHHRAEAVRLFHYLYPALAPAAQRYFDEVTTP